MHFFPLSSVPLYLNYLMWLKWGRLKRVTDDSQSEVKGEIHLDFSGI